MICCTFPLDAEALGELLSRQTGELYEALQSLAEVLRKELRVSVLVGGTIFELWMAL